ncbi:hydroxymethylpyrimidine/phosphomethylpyrimidine kinase [Pseudorhizobium tarimense]|uniref:hydroxymethylpyrimidine kinase n=1 Tax=Pseudorhizobium tarimense TaxID=1079109 RepID=A0ABV2H4J9_9HYPH|nr:bifunctional hydroxymethylpyrimidine kinase/phosphomethylpyrimidine kinase [Pseudorhizobium tarimense]MCJ8518646.1 bifunctional hydroxymethylpyrimidine kinase/phosphomethylpyrimidine kinase [Pseudorhizobium tarimense]
MIANILTIAGSDPSGGAGIQADLKAFAARGTYGMAVLTALTAQNTQGVTGVHLIPADFVASQISAVFDDVRVDAVKIGMIATAEIAEAVADALAAHPDVPVVLDPVMVAKGGASLLAPEAVEALNRRLLPLATLITPNLPEAAALLGENEASDRGAMAAQAKQLMALGPRVVLVKGGHLNSSESPDVLADNESLVWLEGCRSTTRNTHGTGCTLSSAIAAELGKGADPLTAVQSAKNFIATAIERSGELSVGSGHGPVHHFHQWW